MKSRASRYADSIPVALLVAGFILIWLGWNGAASLDYTQGQIPYMISGGMLGLGLVFFGATSLIIQTIKKGQAKQLSELEALSKATQRVAAMLTFTVADGASANGSGRNPDLVVAGAASFHLPGCRLVQKREGALRIPRDEAQEVGLEPCRVCNP